MKLLRDTRFHVESATDKQLENLAIWLTNCLFKSYEDNMHSRPDCLDDDDAGTFAVIGFTERSIALARLWSYISVN
jgi:hypothetical protein